jgi:RimJ/RimL family protein N-acetyltransferase
MAHPYWPLFDLVVRTPMLELRYPDDALCLQLVDQAAQGIHPPDFMPFEMPWTRLEPPELQRTSLQFYWRNRAELTPDLWHLPLATVVDGEVVGSQGATGKRFGVAREVSTGSWLAMAHQGRGIGKEMRTAILHLVFAGLGAEVAVSAAWHDNASSIGVSRAVGYRDNGTERKIREGVPDTQIRFLMERTDWEARRRDDIEIVGLEPCLPLLGAGPGVGDVAP